LPEVKYRKKDSALKKKIVTHIAGRRRRAGDLFGGEVYGISIGNNSRRVDFEEDIIPEKVIDLDQGACRRTFGIDELIPDFPECSKLADVGQIDAYLNEVVHFAALGLDDAFYIVENLGSLPGEIGFPDQIALLVKRHLTRDHHHFACAQVYLDSLGKTFWRRDGTWIDKFYYGVCLREGREGDQHKCDRH
jgi:hypothetical protein